jgi:hypothetical protein
MAELGIAGRVVAAIDQELKFAASKLEPFGALAPVPLMLQLSTMLKTQVASLQTSTVAG